MRLVASASILACLLVAVPAGAYFAEVLLVGGASEADLDRMETGLSEIVNSFAAPDFEMLAPLCTSDGLDDLRNLLDEVALRNAAPVHETRLETCSDGAYEVRNIRVRVEMGETPGSPYQELVFTLTPGGLVDAVRFAMERERYIDLVEEGKRLDDLALRQRILHFVELFRSAHNRKDLEFLRRVYSDEALIIVGRVVEKKAGKGDILEQSFLGREQIEFIKRSKTEYIDALAGVFEMNDFVRVRFEDIKILRHHADHALYGVTLQQTWQSSTYSDSGWVFLMIDFFDREDPLIHVRSWQPERFPDGSVIDLYDFELVR